MRGERLGAARLTGFGPTEFYRMAERRLLFEVVIEGHRAKDFRAGQIQRFGDHADRTRVDIAEPFLQRVEDGQQGALQPG